MGFSPLTGIRLISTWGINVVDWPRVFSFSPLTGIRLISTICKSHDVPAGSLVSVP